MIMKKIYFFLLLLFSLICCQDPNMESLSQQERNNLYQRSIRDAMEIASELLLKEGNHTRAVVDSASCNVWSNNDDSDLFFYIVNFADKKGFVIVSSDTRATPVYAFSDRDNLDIDAISGTGIESYLKNAIQYCQSEINNADSVDIYNSNRPMDPTGPQSWLLATYNGQDCYLEITNITSVKSPLLSTSWSQCNPYNYYCPVSLKYEWAYCGKTAPGCGPLALAQVMRYYSYPPSFDNISFQWELMGDNYSVYSNPTDALEVASLIKMIADDAHAKFGEHDSIATPTSLLDLKSTFEHFGYSLLVSYQLNPQLITNSILENKPVVVMATNEHTRIGHAWVIDGCQVITSQYIYHEKIFPYSEIAAETHAQRYYHCNWGWGYNDVGAYCLNPFSDYSANIRFFYNIQPQL